MTFKDQAREDINSTFANTDEFFDWYDVDNKKMRVMTDDYELLDREKFGKPGAEGPQQTRALIYIPVVDYGPRPKVGRTLLMHKRLSYRIARVSEEAGIYAFTLERCGQ